MPEPESVVSAPEPEPEIASDPGPPAAEPPLLLSVVVVAYNIPRELPRTLMSLVPSYQRHIKAQDYEIIVVDNGSDPPIAQPDIDRFGGIARLIRMDDPLPSPAAAINRGLAAARGEIIGVMIDGARVATPGLLHFALHGAALYPRAVVAALGWYIGSDFQRFGMEAGYDHAAEDDLLGTIQWPNGDGYRLFEIGTLDESSINGWLAPISESNGLFMSRETWDVLGGADERFDRPGGGLLSLDTFSRALEISHCELVVLLGEGTFHQLHGGISTNAPSESRRWDDWAQQYRSIRGQPYTVPLPKRTPTYIGTLPRPVLSHFVRAAIEPRPHHPPPLGPSFDPALWSMASPSPAVDPAIASVIELAHAEFRAKRYSVAAALARFARERAPKEHEPQRLLTLLASALPDGGIPQDYTAEYHAALGDANQCVGDSQAATVHYQAALKADGKLVRAHLGLANQRLSGENYYVWLDRFYTRLKPETIVEIGVFEGKSIACARAPTLAIGVDPKPQIKFPLQANVQLFTETSDEFFARGHLDSILSGRPVSVAFIDGLHLYEQSLKDFINLERYCGPRSVIMFHDMLALDEPTQDRACDTPFHTGDVWKTVLCLKHYRPDLDIFTIATPWTGLTVVTGLDPSARMLADHYDEAVARFIGMPFSEIEHDMERALNVIPNDWATVEARLKAKNIPIASE